MALRARVEGTPARRTPSQGRAPAGAGIGGDLSGLMAAAGNRAVARMVRTLQRDDYTQTVPDVEKTAITRLEVHSLKYGIDDFANRYGDGANDVSKEREKTKESPSHMAVVLVPDTLDLAKPVQIILHFHGWGFRRGDPYAGYLVAAAGSSAPAGTVRDVAQEHWEQQIASLKGQGAQVVAILAQGRGKSDFARFPTFEYIRDVLEKSGRSELVKLAEAENYSVVLSAHSGGGSTEVVPILGRGEAETADRARLKSQLPSKTEHRVVNKLQPVDLVVLYEALNGDGDVDAVMDWVRPRLAGLVPELAGPNRDKALAATPVLRAYYGKGGYYVERYRRLACLIAEEIEAQVPAADRQEVSDRFRVVEVAGPKGEGVEHERVISGSGAASTGSLADALRAARDPKSDRARAVSVGAEECKRLKHGAAVRAEQRKRQAEEAAKARAKAKAN